MGRVRDIKVDELQRIIKSLPKPTHEANNFIRVVLSADLKSVSVVPEGISMETRNEQFLEFMKMPAVSGYEWRMKLDVNEQIKPPLGLKPKYIVQAERCGDIARAMSRYNDAGKEIPKEWVDELQDIMADL